MMNPRFHSRLRLSFKSGGKGDGLRACAAREHAAPGRAGLWAWGLSAALLAGCAAPAPDASRDAELAETLRLAQQARLELQTQSSRLAELEGQVRDLSEMLAFGAERDAGHDRALDSLRRGLPAAAPRNIPANPARAVAPAAAASSEKVRPTPDEATAYREALDHYFARRYTPAITAFQDLLSRYPQGAYADNATYWIGESHYGLGDYAAAQASFERVLSGWPGSAKADDAQLKLGYCHLRRGDARRAGEEFRKLVSLHPSSEYVERAKGELAKLGTP